MKTCSLLEEDEATCLNLCSPPLLLWCVEGQLSFLRKEITYL